jgi:hypothetical protein
VKPLAPPPSTGNAQLDQWMRLAYERLRTLPGSTSTVTEGLTASQRQDLTDGGDSDAHYHAADRSRANHTGTQPASTISDLTEFVQTFSSLQDGDKGDITVSAAGTTWTIDNDAISNAKLRDSGACSVIGRSANSSGDPADISAAANDRLLARTSNALSFQQLTVGMIPDATITYAKIQNVSATDRILGRSTSGAGVIEEITCTSFSRTLLDDADASAWRTTLAIDTDDTVQFGSVLQGHSAALSGVAGGSSITPTSQVAATGVAASQGLFRYSNNSGGARLLTAKSRGTILGTHAAVVTSDQLGAYSFNGSDGSAFVEGVAIIAACDATPSSGIVPGRYSVFTANASGTLVERSRWDSSGNFSVGATSWGSSAANVFAIANGTAPSTGPADTVQHYSTDLSAGNTIPSIFCEGSGVTNAGITSTTVTHKIAFRVNGTVYYLLATTNGA